MVRAVSNEKESPREKTRYKRIRYIPGPRRMKSFDESGDVARTKKEGSFDHALLEGSCLVTIANYAYMYLHDVDVWT